MPAPAKVQVGTGRLALTEEFSVAVTGHDDAQLQAAIQRALTRWGARTGLRLARPANADAATATLVIQCDGPGKTIPAVDENESYALEIAPQRATLRARTVVGAMRGLETLLQLLDQDAGGFFLPAVTIQDQPRFAWRGLMIDVVRHWQPIEVIERNLDAMALVKLNVLHLHLTDDQGFRVESKTHPEFTTKASDGNYFTQDQIRTIIAYATARGIRVMPEFDLPAHAQAWATAHPELAAGPGPYELLRIWGSNVVLDPTNEQLYALLDDFIGEMAALFPDAYLHIGGDENNGRQWNANPKIQAFIKEHGLKNNAALQTWFNQRLTKIVAKYGKRMIGWDEILQPDLPKDSVVHAWRGMNHLNDAAREGYTTILSNGYYIDLILPASSHYAVDPIPTDSPLTPEQQARVLGGEATMWAEWVTPETIDSRIWPRTAAIAERFWSPREVNDVADMYRRLALVSLRLEEGGTRHESNYEPMLRRIAGRPLAPPEFAALKRFVDAVEPLKRYTRGRNQKGVTQQTPLTWVVDAARPESASAREFAGAVDQFLFGSQPVDANLARQLSAQLRSWHDAAGFVSDRLAPENARLKDVAPVAQSLTAIATAGIEAINALAANAAPAADWRKTRLATIEQAAQPNPAALELPMVPAVRLLVLAAAEQPTRGSLSPDAWRAHLNDLATPKKPAPKRANGESG
jgi:hexosaminidase